MLSSTIVSANTRKCFLQSSLRLRKWYNHLESYQEWKGRAQQWSVFDGSHVKSTFVAWDTLLKPSSYMPDTQWPEFECVKLVDSCVLKVPLLFDGGAELRVLRIVGRWCLWARVWLYSLGWPQIDLSSHSLVLRACANRLDCAFCFQMSLCFHLLEIGSHSSDWP